MMPEVRVTKGRMIHGCHPFTQRNNIKGSVVSCTKAGLSPAGTAGEHWFCSWEKNHPQISWDLIPIKPALHFPKPPSFFLGLWGSYSSAQNDFKSSFSISYLKFARFSFSCSSLCLTSCGNFLVFWYFLFLGLWFFSSLKASLSLLRPPPDPSCPQLLVVVSVMMAYLHGTWSRRPEASKDILGLKWV